MLFNVGFIWHIYLP